jgi:2-polyprenyl-3-methyl-5-hydroxy-6-metoxy-1,4-benzoquinol methylase
MGGTLVDRFDDAYRGTPPWDIGRPQPAFVALAEEGAVRGSVLDAGCGTGERALYFASLGHETWGIDGSPLAIERARQKAQERALAVEFRVHDALALDGLRRTFGYRY